MLPVAVVGRRGTDWLINQRPPKLLHSAGASSHLFTHFLSRSPASCGGWVYTPKSRHIPLPLVAFQETTCPLSDSDHIYSLTSKRKIPWHGGFNSTPLVLPSKYMHFTAFCDATCGSTTSMVVSCGCSAQLVSHYGSILPFIKAFDLCRSMWDIPNPFQDSIYMDFLIPPYDSQILAGFLPHS